MKELISNNNLELKELSCSLVPPILGAITGQDIDKLSDTVLPKPSGLMDILITKKLVSYIFVMSRVGLINLILFIKSFFFTILSILISFLDVCEEMNNNIKFSLYFFGNCKIIINQ